MDSSLDTMMQPSPLEVENTWSHRSGKVDVYFSADVETDGPIPGPFSMLSFAIVLAGTFDGVEFRRPSSYSHSIYKELKPISDLYEPEALRVNGLDRERLLRTGEDPEVAMQEASCWVRSLAGSAQPVLVAYPLSFDWTWLYWYFVRYARDGSPFDYSKCFDIKTALAVKARIPVSEAGRSRIHPSLRTQRPHTHNALDDAVAQADLFANIFQWEGQYGRNP